MTHWPALSLLLILPLLAGAPIPPPPGGPGGQAPVVARVTFANRQQLDSLARELDVWEAHPESGYLVALLQPEQREALLQAGYRLEVDEGQTAQLDRPLRALPGQTVGIPGYPCYRTVEETYASMAQLATDHPNLAAWADIGDSWDKATLDGPEGYDLYALTLTNTAIPGPKPRFFLIAESHARELAAAELAARFAEHLVAYYGVLADVTWLLDYAQITIVPLANPDGRKQAETGTWWRKNTDSDDGCPDPTRWGTDLNRNSSFHWGTASANPCSETYRGPAAASEPETMAIQDAVTSLFNDQRGPGDQDPVPADGTGVFITLHSFGGLVLFPYGFRVAPAPNHTQLQTLGRKFGYSNGYDVCQPGSCLYLASGTTDDWAYGELGLAAYTFEVGTSFFQDCTTFENTIWPDNLEALLYAAKAARRPYQDPSGPESLQASVDPTAALSGTPIAVTALADDTRYDSNGHGNEPVQTIAAARYSIDAPSWITGTALYPLGASDGTFDESVEELQATLDTAGLVPGRHLIFVESQDADGHWGVPSAAFLVLYAQRLYLPLVQQSE